MPLEFQPVQAQGIGDDGNGAERHGSTGDHGAEEQAEERIQNARGNGHAKRIVEKREEKILANVAHRGAAESTRSGNAAKIAMKQRNGSAFGRHIRAGGHGDADIGLRERGSVVDAIAGNRDNTALMRTAL